VAIVNPHMQRGYHELTRQLALTQQKLVNVNGNVQYALATIAYARRKK
jgi:hypothetical protein